jgi:hypothetical protein
MVTVLVKQFEELWDILLDELIMLMTPKFKTIEKQKVVNLDVLELIY